LIGDAQPFGAARQRGRLLAGAALLALLAAPAAAQTTSVPPASSGKTSSNTPGADGLDQQSFYLEADTLSQDQDTNNATAEGHVQLRYRGRTLRAQSVIYNSDTGVVTAKGDVVIVNPDGTAEFARELTLDKDLSTGVALGFSARLTSNIKLAANTVIRRSSDLTELNQAIYTPCDICAKDGNPKAPTWSIRASKATEDKRKHAIYYQNAVIQVLGVPVFYTPVFWNADADAVARSGFLTPFIQYSKRRGSSYRQPYLWVLSPSQDLLIDPIVDTDINPFLNLDWRQRFYSGALDARVGYTYEREFDNSGNLVPGSALTSRGYVLANGAFNLDSNWKWGFTAERVSDEFLFNRYDIQGVYQRRGLFDTDAGRLLSQAYAVREDQDSYISISASDFQGTRTGDVSDQLPIVAPLIEARFEPDQPILGGRLKLDGSAVVLTRPESMIDPTQPGVDSRRATAEGEWNRSFTLGDGLRIEPFGSARFDLYNVANQTPGEDAKTTPRSTETAGVDLSWPLIRQTDASTIILEPLVEGAISPRASPNPNIPNEDSVDFVFDETDLFEANRSPGFDVYDSGARLNVGGRATVDWDGGQEAYGFIGRSFRTSPDLLIPAYSGYSGTSSDWIFAASASVVKGLSLYGRTQLDGETFAVRRVEIGGNYVFPFIRGYVRYLQDYTDSTIGTLHAVEGSADVFVTKHWGIVAYGQRDLQLGEWTRRDIGIAYQDDCTRVEVVYHHEAAMPANLGGPVDAVQLRLTLATLGEQRYRDQDGR